MTSSRIACLGVIVADIVGVPIDTLPRRGTLELIERVELHIGGNASNAAATLGKLGEPAALVGKIGTDLLGDLVVGALTAAGVDLSPLVRDGSTTTATSLVCVHSDAERSFLHVPGANAALRAQDILWDRLGGVDFFLIAGLQLLVGLEGPPIAAVARCARERGMTIVLDSVMNPRSQWWAGLEPALPHLDWCVPSYEEAALLTGERDPERQARALTDAGARNAAIKLNADGCLLRLESGELLTVPAFRVEAVDTLGAGDAWCAGFLAGLRRRMPPGQAARLANRVAADCVSALGATSGIRPLSDTLSRL